MQRYLIPGNVAHIHEYRALCGLSIAFLKLRRINILFI